MFQILTNSVFLAGLGLVLLSALGTTIFAGGLGVAFGFVIDKKKCFSRYTIRILRLGLWLPVYLVWGLSIWRIPVRDDGFMLGLSKIVAGAMATGPSVFLAACYYYLCAQAQKRAYTTRTQLTLFRETFLFALLLTVLWQIFFPRAWPWGWLVHSLPANYAVVLVIASSVLVVNLICRWALQDRMKPEEGMTSDPVPRQSLHPLVSFLLLGFIVLSVWQTLSLAIRNDFRIVAPVEVGQALLQLLLIGSNAFADKRTTTLWFDIGVSLVNIFAAAGLATLLAITFVKAGSQYLSLKLLSLTMAFTCIAPIALANLIMIWFGIGLSQKIITLVCFSFCPIAQAFWNCRSSRLMPAILASVDAGLPYAFIGMVFSEAMAATSGIGFFMIVFPANGHLAEATATGLIAFAILTSISLALRFAARLTEDSA
jgi:ABC-type nitrate/sulfonate/bicarbonate transport system permease component